MTASSSTSPWQRRLLRAEELIQERPFAAEILQFYICVARFQEGLHRRLNRPDAPAQASIDETLNPSLLPELISNFEGFLVLTEGVGPKSLSVLAREIRDRGTDLLGALLKEAWSAQSPSDAQGFLALAFLQSCAELARSRSDPRAGQHTYAVCPVCNRKPVVGVLRQQGEGAARSLVCGFCGNEWQFRRLVCPGCGEENDRLLPVFTASDFDYIRVECCETCKTYIKTVDLTRNGRAEPIVDELASAPLDLWAQERGYAKLQKNMLGL